MADNVQADLATTSGAIFKTDQDSGDSSHAPFTKLMFGPLNTFTVVDSTHGLPVEIVASSAIAVTGTFWQATQPISAASLPLPSGAATAANQATVISGLSSIDGHVDGIETLLTSIESDTGNLVGIAGNISVIVSGLASIQSDLTTIGGYVDGLETLIGTTNTTLGTINTKITACNTGAVVIASGSVSISGSVAVTGTFWQATQPVSIASTVAVTQSGAWTVAATTLKPDGTNTMPSLDVVGRAGFVKITDGTNTMPTMDSTARPGFVNLNLAGTAVSGNSGNKDAGTIRVVLATDQPALTNTQPVKDLAQTSGGLSMHCSGPLANSNNATNVKASAGQVYAIQVFNVTATVAYLKLYNKASAPAPGSDTPVKVIPIPANTSVGGVSVKWEKGLEFTTGISYAVVTGISGTDNTSVAANSGIVNIDYK